MLAGRRVVLYVDDDAALSTLVKGTSTSLPSARLANELWQCAALLGLHLWVDRVPSRSNPADAPSRARGAVLQAWGFTEVNPIAEGLQAW